MVFKHNEGIKVFKALADDNRLEIMELLMSGEKCGCALLEALKIGQPTLSHHMRILCDAGLVDACKEGKWVHYSLSIEGSAKVRALSERYTLSPEKACSYKKCDSCYKKISF
ncbi:MAG: winged helix-turn-helix transcriptional regulator [Proteobacteria bacterium]|nr:winged helix-turn-helix transcriptional regulator [Pseudomonadota bacterium]